MELTQSSVSQMENTLQEQSIKKSEMMEDAKFHGGTEAKSVLEDNNSQSSRNKHDQKEDDFQKENIQRNYNNTQNEAQEAHSQNRVHKQKQNHALEAQSKTQGNDEKQNHTREDGNIKLMSVSVTFKSQSEAATCVSGHDTENLSYHSIQTVEKHQGEVNILTYLMELAVALTATWLEQS